MPFNPTPQTIIQADYDALKVLILAVLTKVDAMNNTSTALTVDERKKSVAVGPARKPFNDYYYENKNNYADLKPGQTVVSDANAEKHYFIHTKAGEPLGLLTTALEKLQDMQLNSEHFAYGYASKGRLAAKDGAEAGLPGADSFFSALDELFPQSSGPGNDAQNPQPNP